MNRDQGGENEVLLTERLGPEQEAGQMKADRDWNALEKSEAHRITSKLTRLEALI